MSTSKSPLRLRKRRASIEPPLIRKRVTRSSRTPSVHVPAITGLPQTTATIAINSTPGKPEKSKTISRSSVPVPEFNKGKRSSSTYAPPSKYAHLDNKLTDSLAPNLICVFIGVNPGIRTATAGHAYAHPSNLFWKLLHSSGCTSRRCAPEEDHDLPRLYALGNTNIVARPTKDASELGKLEMEEGVGALEEKVRTYRPESVAVVGKGIWEALFRVWYGRKMRKEEFAYGWQERRMGAVRAKDGEAWEGAKVFVATTTSGLAAGMRPWEKEEVWKVLGDWVQGRREERRAKREFDQEANGEGIAVGINVQPKDEAL